MAETREMSVATRVTRQKTPRPMSPTERNKLATQQIVRHLGANDQGKEKTAAITAALEIISERLAHDIEIQQTLNQKYNDLKALGTPRQLADSGSMPKPVGTPGRTKTTPLTIIDPYDLRDTYGSDQLRTILQQASQGGLREAVRVVKARNPGTKPEDGRSNTGMIEYIVKHVSPGY